MSVRPTTQPSARDLQEQEALLEIRGGAKKQEEVAAIIGGKASIPASIFNLVNTVAGAGILTLSSGMATGTGWVPAILICSVLGLLSSHTFAIIGEACELTGEVDFKVHTFLLLPVLHIVLLTHKRFTGSLGSNNRQEIDLYCGWSHCHHVPRLCCHLLWYPGGRVHTSA